MVCSWKIHSEWYVVKLTLSCSGLGGQMWQVILGRAVTGVGGAGIVILASVIITGEQQYISLVTCRLT